LAELLVRQGKTQEAIIEFNRILESSSRVTSDEDRNLLHNYATNMISSLENANSHEGEKV
jgi:hypothetical protein